LARLGFRTLGDQMLRVDLAERSPATRTKRARQAGARGGRVWPPRSGSAAAIARLMKDLGFRPSTGEAGWIWRGAPPEGGAPRPILPMPLPLLAELRRNG
jgi:hypothetical protein